MVFSWWMGQSVCISGVCEVIAGRQGSAKAVTRESMYSLQHCGHKIRPPTWSLSFQNKCSRDKKLPAPKSKTCHFQHITFNIFCGSGSH